MKPSRALYLFCGAGLQASVAMPWPGAGAAIFVAASILGACAIAFDWSHA